jgi:hypothetical protein
LALGVGLALGFALGVGFAFGLVLLGELDGFGLADLDGVGAAGVPAGAPTIPDEATEFVPAGCPLARMLNPMTTMLTADITAVTRRLIAVPRGCRSPREPLLVQLLWR